MSSPPAEDQPPSAPPPYTEQDSTQEAIQPQATVNDENATSQSQPTPRPPSIDQGYPADTETAAPRRTAGGEEEAQEPWPPLYIDPLLAQAEAVERKGGVQETEGTTMVAESSAVTAQPEQPTATGVVPTSAENRPPTGDRPTLSGSTLPPAYNENDPTTWDPAVIAAITQWAARVSEHPLSSDATVVHHARPRMAYESLPRRESCGEKVKAWCCPCCCCSWLSIGHFERVVECEFAGDGWVGCVDFCKWITRPCRWTEREEAC